MSPLRAAMDAVARDDRHDLVTAIDAMRSELELLERDAGLMRDAIATATKHEKRMREMGL